MMWELAVCIIYMTTFAELQCEDNIKWTLKRTERLDWIHLPKTLVNDRFL